MKAGNYILKTKNQFQKKISFFLRWDLEVTSALQIYVPYRIYIYDFAWYFISLISWSYFSFQRAQKAIRLEDPASMFVFTFIWCKLFPSKKTNPRPLFQKLIWRTRTPSQYTWEVKISIFTKSPGYTEQGGKYWPYNCKYWSP